MVSIYVHVLMCLCPCVLVCIILGQALQYSRKQNRLLSFLQDPEVNQEDDVQSLRVLQR